MYKDLLPIGSVVLLKGGERKLMITGRIITDANMEEIYDYVGVIYPIGVTGEGEQFFFNRDGIDSVYFIGFQDGEELAFRSEVLNELGELTIKNGEIVPVEEA
ncbi:MAG: DUF4176 domain-containing protein [Lachnospiraceae bacterium]|nr:DUF4176 domain-containing protein [Lachnospiraceae bacterium]